MRALKIENRELPPNPSQQPSSSRRKRSSQPSSKLSSSEECLVAEKGREKERKWEKGGSSGQNCHLPSIAKSEVIDRFVQTEAYICSDSREITKETKTKSYYKG